MAHTLFSIGLLAQAIILTAANPILDRLNRQYAMSKPSNNWTEAGVLAHVIDWAPEDKPWLPCAADGSQSWCTNWSDRISSSMVSPTRCTSNQDCLYAGGGVRPPFGGLIYSTSALYDAVLCSWALDGDTSDRLCDPPGNSTSCIPGCYGLSSSTDKGKPIWCTTPPSTNWCPYEPWRVAEMMQMWELQRDFNEVVVDAASFRARIPDAIEMFFFPVECSDECKEKVGSDVKTTRLALNLTAAQLPLVSVNLTNKVTPFACVSCA